MVRLPALVCVPKNDKPLECRKNINRWITTSCIFGVAFVGDTNGGKDANKGISLIEYNYLKLPKKIVIGTTTILNQYDAGGKKLKETIGTNVTDYESNLIYKNNVLYQLSHDEGRIC